MEIKTHQVSDSKAIQTPDLETIKKFVEQDLHAAHYMLGLVLSTKSIREAAVEEMANQIFEFGRINTPIDKETAKKPSN